MTTMPKQVWWAKYRPNTLDTYIFQNKEQEKLLRSFVENKELPYHIILHGVRGTGKTTLANILINALVPEEYQAADVLRLRGGSDNKIDDIRSRFVNHVSSVPMGDVKIVFIDEADRLSPQAQDALKSILEDYIDNARVIFTTNHVSKFSPELRSRFEEFKFNKLKPLKIMEYCIDILDEEGVNIDDPDNIEVLKQACELYPADLRKIVSTLDRCQDGDKLVMDNLIDANMQEKLDILDLINEDNWIKARKIAAENFTDDELVEVYRFIYEYLEDTEKFSQDKMKWKKGIIIISDYMYRHAVHPDQEINFASCLIKLSEL